MPAPKPAARPGQPRASLLLKGLVLLIALGALGSYYWIHKPFDLPLAAAVVGALLDVLTVGLLVACAGGIGRRLLGSLIPGGVVPGPLSRPERLALEAGAGLGALATGGLLLGLAGLYRGVVLWGVLLLAGLLALRPLLGWLKDLRGVLARALHPQSGWERFLLALVIVWLLGALLLALAPPHAWDALMYHLVGPKHYLEQGRITLVEPGNLYLGFPQLVEVLYGVVMSAFGRDTAAAPLHLAVGVLALMAVAGLVRRHTDAASGWLAVAFLLSAYSLWLLLGKPYVDLAAMLYGALGFSAAAAWRADRRDGWLILMGLCAGLALGVKYTAGILLIMLLVYVGWHTARRGLRAVPRAVLIVGGVALLVFVPWLLRGLLLYENPVYPLAFGGANWTAARAAIFNSTLTDGAAVRYGLLGTAQAWHLAVLPLAASVFGVEGITFSYGFASGPWLLTLWLLLPLGWRSLDDRARALAQDCVLLGIPALTVWIGFAAVSSLGTQTRLVMAALPVVAVAGTLGVYGISRWPRGSLDAGFVLRGVVAVALILAAVQTVQHTLGSRALAVQAGTLSQDAYLRLNLGSHYTAMQRLAALPEESLVYLLWEPREYYCPPRIDCVADVNTDLWALALAASQSAGEAFRQWQAGGVDYLLLWESGYAFHQNDPRVGTANPQFGPALAESMVLLWSEGDYTLYGWP